MPPKLSYRSRSARRTPTRAALASGPVGHITHYAYDIRGHLASVIDALGAVTTVRCDPAGLPLEVTGPVGGITRYERDTFGRPVRITDPLGAVVLLQWTIEGELARRTGPDGATESWTYDGEGNCLTHTDPIGGTTRFEYTHFDLLVARTGPDGARYEFAHDAELRLRQVTNPQGLTWSYTYDPAGRLISETDFDQYTQPADGRTNAYAYDALGRRTRRATPTGRLTTYGYDHPAPRHRLPHPESPHLPLPRRRPPHHPRRHSARLPPLRPSPLPDAAGRITLRQKTRLSRKPDTTDWVNLLGDGHADRVGQPSAPLREPFDECAGACAGIRADQRPLLSPVPFRGRRAPSSVAEFPRLSPAPCGFVRDR